MEVGDFVKYSMDSDVLLLCNLIEVFSKLLLKQKKNMYLKSGRLLELSSVLNKSIFHMSLFLPKLKCCSQLFNHIIYNKLIECH